MTSQERRSVYERLDGGHPHAQVFSKLRTPGVARFGNPVKRTFSRNNARGRRVKNQNNIRQRLDQNATRGIPSLLSGPLDSQPRPLFDPETVEKLRASLRSVSDRLNYSVDDAPIDYDDNPCKDRDEGREANLRHRTSDVEQDDGEDEKEEVADRQGNDDYIDLAADDCIDLEAEREDDETYEENEELSEQAVADSSATNETLDIDKYLEKERETKKQIDEIIMVAQALREKLERDEEIKRKALEIIKSPPAASVESEHALELPQESNCSVTSRSSVGSASEIPRLMDLKPRIPSLLDLNVKPPPIGNVIMETIMVATSGRNDVQPGLPDVCWNCEKRGHRYFDCRQKKLRQFCFHCGRLGFDVSSCPYCTKYM